MYCAKKVWEEAYASSQNTSFHNLPCVEKLRIKLTTPQSITFFCQTVKALVERKGLLPYPLLYSHTLELMAEYK